MLVCIGDSWTWGDSLGDTFCQDNKYNTEYRTSVFYGTVLSQLLDSDLVNLAKPAASNWHIYNNLKNFLSNFYFAPYKRVIFVLTLTENFRELADPSSWPVRDFSVPCNSLHDLINDYERRMLLDFATVFEQYPVFEFCVGRNFTRTQSTNCSLVNHLDKTWTEILQQAQDIEPYPEDTIVLSDIAVYPLLQYLRDNNLERKFMPELDKIITNSLLAVDWLERSKLNHHAGTKHPNELGHRLWAEYIHTQL